MTGEELASLEELDAWVRETAEELNEILEERGFSIRLEPWIPQPGKFGVVAIYDITIEWIVEGITQDPDTGQKYAYDGKPFFYLPRVPQPEEPEPGVELRPIEFHELNGDFANPVVKIPGKRKGDFLCLTRATQPLEQFELIDEAVRLRKEVSQSRPAFGWDGIYMPNILYDSEIDISWLVGFYTEVYTANHKPEDDPIIWWISEALMEAKFAMGPKGARAKVAVALALERLSISAEYVANHDLIIWMERDGVDTAPFFVIYVPKSEFADHTVDLSEID